MSWNPWWNENNSGGYNPYDWKSPFKYYNKIINDFINDPEVGKRVNSSGKVIAKIKKGDKVYRVTLEEITPFEEKIEIEFEDDPPDKHPDYTE